MTDVAEMFNHSDYIIFADESGDHGLMSIDASFPVFALVFCIVKKTHYIEQIVPAVQRLKMNIWGHDQVIFHEHDIRKEKGLFGLLRTNRDLRTYFLERLNDIIQQAEFDVVVSVVDKYRLTQKYTNPFNPYEIAMLFCMERSLGLLKEKGQTDRRVPVLFESRGSKEDGELELEFRRICDNQGRWGYKMSDFQAMQFEHLFVDKKSNSVGLQLADLIARPLALKHLRAGQSNRALDVLASKRVVYKVFP